MTKSIPSFIKKLLFAAAVGIASQVHAVEVDVLIMYDQDTEELQNGVPTAMAHAMIADGNVIFQNSNVDIQLRLAGLVKQDDATYRAGLGRDRETKLSNLANSAFAQNARDEANADFVFLLTELNWNDGCGVAYITTVQRWAYGLGKSSCGSISFVHELGHNMGLAHSRNQSDTSPAVYDYGMGHGKEGVFVTLMAYPEAWSVGYNKRLSLFSNPNLTCTSGFPCGIPEGQPNSADAAKAINKVKNIVASHRVASVPTTTFDLPGNIEAEDYSDAPNDSTTGNQNSAAVTKCDYKGMDVDVQNANEGTCTVGWTTSGEELIYNIDSAGGDYDVTLRAASKYAGKRIALYVNDSFAGQASTTGTDWQQFENLTISNVSIPSDSKLTVVFLDGSVNLNFLSFAEASGGASININAVDYTYSTGIQLVSNNTAVGYFDEGDQLQFANTEFSGLQSITIEYAARWVGREIEIRRNWLNGPLLATVTLPSTGNWSNYETLNIPLLGSTGSNKLVIKGKTGNSIANFKTITLQY